ncbi:hypothetical protein ABEW00_05015 [Rossellomorea vietnamensis]|uniref:hypothetical protein n=1 Tax=Rossellomorea vietnamensis TaxID=218284 RepID=UPI003D2BD085
MLNLPKYVDDDGQPTYLAKDVEDHLNAQQRKRDAYKAKQEKESAIYRKNQKAFLKVSTKEMNNINKGISLVDAGLFFRLTMNMQLRTGSMLVDRVSGGEAQPLTQTDMQKLLNKSNRGIKKVLMRLEELSVIRKEKQGRRAVYFVNENIVSIGKQKNAQPFAKVYKVKAKEMLNDLTDSEVGLLLKLMPYANYHYLTLTHNPTEADPKKAKPLRMQEVAELVGITEQSFNVLVSKLKRKYALATLDTGTKGKALIINPYLCDRGNDSKTIEAIVSANFRLMEN